MGNADATSTEQPSHRIVVTRIGPAQYGQVLVGVGVVIEHFSASLGPEYTFYLVCQPLIL
jgi:hypothetical protein